MNVKKPKTQKLTLFSAILMSLGSIIGAGVFSATPVAIKIVGGSAVVIGFLCGAVMIFFKEFSSVCIGSALPASGGAYMRNSRLVHPVLGMMHVFVVLMTGAVKIATLALTFSTYFCVLFPQVPNMAAAAVCILFFTFLTTYGLRVSSVIQDISVVILVIALLMYVILGMPHNSLTLKDVLAPAVQFARLWAGISILEGSLYGANVLMGIADDIDKPRRNIPIGYIVSTLTCTFLYCFVGWVTVGGKIPWFQVKNLADVAKTFMGPGMLAFFITGGALLAVITSMNAILLSFSRDTFVAARDIFFPAKLANINKHGAPANALWLNAILALILVFGKFNLADVTMISTIPTTIFSPLYLLPLLVVMRKYPLSFKDNFFRAPFWVVVTVAVVAKVMGFTMGISVLTIMGRKNWMSAIIYFSFCAVYAVGRYLYLKKKKINLMDRMRRPYEPWEKHERELEAALSAKKAKAAK